MRAGLMALVLASCVGRSDVYPDPDRGSAPRRGGTLRIARESDPDSLDPGRSSGWYTARILVCVHRQLLTFADAEEPEGYELVPDLAVALPEVSEDGRRYTLQVRGGVRYSPPVAREVEARDFQYAIERVLRLATPAAPSYTGIEGAREYQDRRARSVRGIEVAGDRITFTLSKPDPTFPYKLALLAASPVPREAAEGHDDDYSFRSAASGPYEVERYVPRRRIVLRRNPSDASSAGFADRMEIEIGVSVENAYAALRHGELDAVIGDAPPSQLFRFRRDRRWRPNAFLRGFPDMTWIVLNTKVEPFDDPRVRKAVCHAIDPRAIVKAVLGVAVVPKGLLPSTVPGFEEGEACPGGHDPARARELLAEAGLGRGFSTVLYAYNVNPFPRMAEAIQAMLGQVGIDVEIRVVNGSVWDAVVGRRATRPPMVMAEWIASLPDPSDWLENNFSPFRLRADANSNYTEWDTPSARELFRRAADETDPERRMEAWREVAREVNRETIAIPIAEGLAFNVVGARVRGFLFHPIWGPMLERMWLVR
ncbi:MAG: hypothetical protein HYY06_17315 [Deltaproteobacteria bacterium]|nr:hypothetical protein [Deltaproteobacteria bacterium]